MDMWPLWFFASLGFLILTSFAVYKYAIGNPERAHGMKKIAIELQARYVPKDDSSVQKKLIRFPLVRDAKFRKITHILYGTSGGIAFIVFDYHYTKRIRGIYRRGSQDETVIVIYSPKCHLPQFAILAKNIMEPMISEYKEIILENHSVLAEKYHIQGNDGTAVMNLIAHHEMELATMLQGMNVQGDGSYLLFYRTRQLLPTERILQHLQATVGAVRILC
jgi:hypothetical protein